MSDPNYGNAKTTEEETFRNLELPEGWTVTKVREAFESFGGGTPNRGTSTYWGGPIPWLSSGGIKTDRVESASEFITQEGLQNSAARLCRAGSVVVVVRSGILAHTLPVGVLSSPATINQDIKCFDSGDGDLNGWLALALRHSAKSILALNREGTTVQSVKYETLRDFSLQVPPLAEQKRIVAKIEDLLAQVDTARARLRKVAQILKRFRQAVLAAACSGRLTEDWRERHESKEWDEVSLMDVIEDKPKNGYSARPVKHKTSWKVLTLTATTSGTFDARHFKYVDEQIPEDSTLWLQPDDLLVQRGNTIEYVGVPAIYDGPPNEFIYPDLMMRFRANARVNTRFLYFALSWEETRTYLRERATGTAGSMPKINQTTLVGVPIKLPPPSEQHEIVRRVETLFKLADAIEKHVAAATKRVDKLTQAILAKAFRGELVPTEAELARREGREYETATALLARIKAERATSNSATSNGATSNRERSPRRKRRTLPPR